MALRRKRQLLEKIQPRSKGSKGKDGTPPQSIDEMAKLAMASRNVMYQPGDPRVPEPPAVKSVESTADQAKKLEEDGIVTRIHS